MNDVQKFLYLKSVVTLSCSSCLNPYDDRHPCHQKLYKSPEEWAHRIFSNLKRYGNWTDYCFDYIKTSDKMSCFRGGEDESS